MQSITNISQYLATLDTGQLRQILNNPHELIARGRELRVSQAEVLVFINDALAKAAPHVRRPVHRPLSGRFEVKSVGRAQAREEDLYYINRPVPAEVRRSHITIASTEDDVVEPIGYSSRGTSTCSFTYMPKNYCWHCDLQMKRTGQMEAFLGEKVTPGTRRTLVSSFPEYVIAKGEDLARVEVSAFPALKVLTDVPVIPWTITPIDITKSAYFRPLLRKCPKFDGMMMNTLTPKNEDILIKIKYSVSPKRDGERVLVALHGGGMYIMRRDSAWYQIPGIVSGWDGALFDGELDLRAFQIILFDTLYAPDGDYRSRPYPERLKPIYYLVSQSRRFQFQPVLHGYDAAQFREWLDTPGVEGLVLTPTDEPYVNGWNPHQFRWRPKGSCTVDFQVKHVGGNVYDLLVRSSREVHEKVGQLDSPHRFIDGTIVECVLRNGAWMFVRVREDKRNGNYRSDLELVLEAQEITQFEISCIKAFPTKGDRDQYVPWWKRASENGLTALQATILDQKAAANDKNSEFFQKFNYYLTQGGICHPEFSEKIVDLARCGWTLQIDHFCGCVGECKCPFTLVGPGDRVFRSRKVGSFHQKIQSAVQDILMYLASASNAVNCSVNDSFFSEGATFDLLQFHSPLPPARTVFITIPHELMMPEPACLNLDMTLPFFGKKN